MKCEHVQERFPELQDHPDLYPEALAHLEQCDSCKRLYHVFTDMCKEGEVTLSPVRKEENCRNIYRKIRRHDRIVLTRRVTGIAAVLALVFLSVFNLNSGFDPSLTDISDDVLFLASDAAIMPEPAIGREVMIEYLAQYEYIDVLGGLF
ncbi:MAG: hypothetical protein K0B52_00070 [FCB group bacterium]|nr:hypothetical protein [FCB group bacterium]